MKASAFFSSTIRETFYFLAIIVGILIVYSDYLLQSASPLENYTTITKRWLIRHHFSFLSCLFLGVVIYDCILLFFFPKNNNKPNSENDFRLKILVRYVQVCEYVLSETLVLPSFRESDSGSIMEDHYKGFKMYRNIVSRFSLGR